MYDLIGQDSIAGEDIGTFHLLFANQIPPLTKYIGKKNKGVEGTGRTRPFFKNEE
jgi:hypothetical protein